MLATRLLVTVLFGAVFAAIAFWVAVRLLRRPAEGDAGRAVRMFALWWAAFGADTLLNALTWTAGGLGLASEAVTAVLTYLALTSIVLMTWGLTYYLVYLVTGRAGAFWPIAAFYAVSLVLFVALLVYLRPIGVTMLPWAGEVAYANKPPAIAELLVALYFLLPPLGGAITYGVVGLRVRGRAQRYRILAVSLGILVWFTSALLFTGSGAGKADAGNVMGKVLSLACMLLILSAYVTPAWLDRWLEGGQAPALQAPSRDERRARRRAELTRRVRDLV